MIGVDNITRRSEGPLARWRSRNGQDRVAVEEPRRSLGPVANARGGAECGRSTAWGRAV